MRIYKNIPKRILSLCLVFAIGISMGVLSDHFVSENSRFQTFTEKLFRSEVCSNTLTLHYTLAHPEKKGIRKPEATLGTALSDPAKTTSLCQEYEKELKSFAYSRLSEENRLTCDMLLLYFHTRASLGKNSALDEPLGPGLGVQAQLPILLAEYTFRTKEDISDYLKLLSTVRPYFQSIIKLEKQKSQSGLFMSDTTLDRILKQCHSFVANPDSNYMDDIFAQKLKAFSNPAFNSEDQKKLCTYHHKLILTEVIPAYQELADSLESLRGTGKSSRGLAFFEGGREYYLYLLQSQTGTYVPVGQIEKRLSAQLLSDYREISSLLKQNSSLIDRLNQCSGELTLTPTQMLEKLPELMKKDFPELKDATYELRTVHPSMKKFLSPAFYLTPPVDTRTPNVIYINDSGHTSSLELFGTLAHEGFPGHLYQTVSFAENNPSDIRYLVTSSMPFKLIRLSGSLADESFPVIRLFHVFFQNRKLYRSDVQNPAVKFFQVEIISKSFLTDCFQIKEIQISPIVFQIVTGSFHNILIDFGSSGSIVDAKCFQKDSSAGCIPAPVMNADIDQGVNAQIHTPV